MQFQSDFSCRWIYTLFLSVDANFKLRLKDRGIKDEFEFSSAWTYYVGEEHFQKVINTFGAQVDVSHSHVDDI